MLVPLIALAIGAIAVGAAFAPYFLGHNAEAFWHGAMPVHAEAEAALPQWVTWAPLEVNALQRASTVVIQKSLREGFGLTVSEALWKKKPVVVSAVGGIPTQIIHKHTGMLTHSIEGTAYQIRFLLSHPEIAAKLGEHGHEHDHWATNHLGSGAGRRRSRPGRNGRGRRHRRRPGLRAHN